MNALASLKERLTEGRSPVRPYLAFAVAAAAAVALTMVLGLGASRWIGETFPGFLVLPNRVVASIGRLDWPATREGTFYQSVVAAVDDVPVTDSQALYRRVADATPSTVFRYDLREGPATEMVVVPSVRFTSTDFLFLFGAYLATGLLYVLTGLLGVTFLPERRLATVVLALGGVGGLYALSAVAIYDPDGGLALHALAEALFPASLVHLAVALSRRDGTIARTIVATSWWLSIALAIPYELLLEQPAGYSTFHAACETYLGLAGAAFVVTMLVERFRRGDEQSALERAALAGAVLGLGIPAVIMTLSGLSGGALPVNLVTATAFLFPLGLAWGVVREHLTVASAEMATAHS